MSFWLLLGGAVALMAITAAGIYSGRQVKTAEDFSGGSARAGSMVVAGTIIGTLVGGSSTIGTAQLAFRYGLSAWWFTLGAGIACLILELGFVRPLRRTGASTLTAMIGMEYGAKARVLASVLNAIGTFINVIAQLLSGTAILAILFPQLPVTVSAAAVALLMLFYVVFGGVWGTGLVGVVKTVLLYLSVMVSGVLAFRLAGGLEPLYEALPHETYFNLFARGFSTDAGAGVSLILGVLSTQTYAQAVLAGRTDREARRGALISACMIPPVGIGGILVGMYMRLHTPEAVLADEALLAAAAKTAFPRFILAQLPPFAAGLVLMTLLVAVLGTGAGLSLGISTIVHRDLVNPLTDRFRDPGRGLWFSRGCIVVVLALATALTSLPADFILDLGFLSMGLRAAVVFTPLLGALFLPGRVHRYWAVAAIALGPVSVLVGKLLAVPFDPLFVGMGAALLCLALGAITGKRPAAGERHI